MHSLEFGQRQLGSAQLGKRKTLGRRLRVMAGSWRIGKAELRTLVRARGVASGSIEIFKDDVRMRQQSASYSETTLTEISLPVVVRSNPLS